LAKKKKTKKTKKTKKNISKNDKIKSEIIGIIFIAVSIMLFLSQKYESGVVGNYVKHILINLTGNAFDTLPYIMIALGGFYIFGLVNKDRKNKSIILIFIFLSYLGLITLLPLNLVESFNDFREIIETTGENTNPIYTYGGGILGGLLSFVLTKLFGYMGTIVILFTVILISIISITKKSILNMIKKFFVFVYKVILSMFNGIKKATKSSKKSNNLNQRKKNKKEKPETLGKKQKENYQIKGYDEPKDKDLSKKNDVLNLSKDKN